MWNKFKLVSFYLFKTFLRKPNRIVLKKISCHASLANYFSSQPLFFDGDLQKNPNIRKCVEQPYQQTKARLWDEVTDTLCNLDFFQAKAVARRIYDLEKDFYDVLKVIPENSRKLKKELIKQKHLGKYTNDLIAFAKGEISVLEVPESGINDLPWEKREKETNRKRKHPTLLDQLDDFYNFLGQQAANLHKYAEDIPHMALQLAWNNNDDGPVGRAASESPRYALEKLILCKSGKRPVWNPFPAIKRKFNENNESVAAITPDGKKAILGTNNNTCILWDLGKNRLLKILETSCNVRALDITPDARLAISAMSDNTCIVWDLVNGIPLKTLVGHKESINCVSMTPDGRLAISASGYESCILWDLQSGNKIRTLNTGRVQDISITPDGKLAISASRTKNCILWDLESGNSLKTLEHDSEVYAVAITPDGKLALSGCEDSTCRLWNLENNQEKVLGHQIIDGHTSVVRAVDITPDGKLALSGSSDSTCIFWDLEKGEIIKTLRGHSSGIKDLKMTADGKLAISGSGDCCILWNLEKESRYNLTYFDGRAFAIFPDSSKALMSSHGAVMLWDLENGKHLESLPYRTKEIWSIAINPNGKLALTGTSDSLILWDLDTWELLKSFPYSSDAFLTAFTPDGKRALSGPFGFTMWNLANGEAIKNYNLDKNEVPYHIVLTPDGKKAITSQSNNLCILWDLESGSILKTLNEHTERAYFSAITPDGKLSLSGSYDSTCVLWNLSTGKSLMTLNVHTSPITFIAVSPDGKIAATCSLDNVCNFWDLKTGKILTRFVLDQKLTFCSLKGTSFFGIGNYGQVYFMNIPDIFLYNTHYIATIRIIWDFELQQYLSPSADCPLCGHRFAPPATVLTTIEKITKKAGLKPEQSQCLELPDEAWDDPKLLGNCPKCGGELKFNPFIAGGDY